MQATTATCFEGGRGSGPWNDSAYRALLASSSSVTDLAGLRIQRWEGHDEAARGCGQARSGASRGRTTPLVELHDPTAGPERLQHRGDHADIQLRACVGRQPGSGSASHAGRGRGRSRASPGGDHGPAGAARRVGIGGPDCRARSPRRCRRGRTRETSPARRGRPRPAKRPAVSGEHFIPFRRTNIVSMCADELPAAERESFLGFVDLLASLLHHRFHARIEALKDAYHPFNPEADTRTIVELDPGAAGRAATSRGRARRPGQGRQLQPDRPGRAGPRIHRALAAEGPAGGRHRRCRQDHVLPARRAHPP